MSWRSSVLVLEHHPGRERRRAPLASRGPSVWAWDPEHGCVGATKGSPVTLLASLSPMEGQRVARKPARRQGGKSLCGRQCRAPPPFTFSELRIYVPRARFRAGGTATHRLVSARKGWRNHSVALQPSVEWGEVGRATSIWPVPGASAAQDKRDASFWGISLTGGILGVRESPLSKGTAGVSSRVE